MRRTPNMGLRAPVMSRVNAGFLFVRFAAVRAQLLEQYRRGLLG